MLIPIIKFYKLLKDPSNADDELIFHWQEEKPIEVSTSKKKYKCINGKPILIDFAKSIINKELFDNPQENVSVIGKRSTFLKNIKNVFTGNERNTEKGMNIFKKNLTKNSTVLLIGAGTIGAGLKYFYNDQSINLIACDIYPSKNIQFIADCHDIPLKDSSVDGVIIQAVLEHVLDPNKVAAEIFRVLSSDGIVYAETPFLQESHEEPYDFTRFTELGHRWLFRNFKEIYRKANGAQGLTLYWSIRSFVRSIIPSKTISNLLSFPFIFFSLFDFLIPEKRKIKGANGLIFIGKKSSEEIKISNIIKHYIGA